MTELLSRSRTIPPATAPRGWHIRFPPCVKKNSRSHAVVTSPVLLQDTQSSACYKRHLLTWSNLTDEVIRTSWCWGNLLSGWGRDSRGLDRDPACRRCHPRTGALSETSAWPLLRPLAETQYWSTGRERERITDNPHMCSETKTAPLPLIHAGNWAQKTVHLLRHQIHPLLKEIYLWKTNQDRRLFSYIDYNAHKQHLNWRKTSWEVTL